MVNYNLYFCRKYGISQDRCRIIGLSYSRKFNYSSSVIHLTDQIGNNYWGRGEVEGSMHYKQL